MLSFERTRADHEVRGPAMSVARKAPMKGPRYVKPTLALEKLYDGKRELRGREGEDSAKAHLYGGKLKMTEIETARRTRYVIAMP